MDRVVEFSGLFNPFIRRANHGQLITFPPWSLIVFLIDSHLLIGICPVAHNSGISRMTDMADWEMAINFRVDNTTTTTMAIQSVV